MAYNFLKISGVYRVADTNTNAIPKSYFNTSGKFGINGSNISITIGGDEYLLALADLKVNGQTPTTTSEAVTLLNSLFGS